jgi:hypothetical protein
LRPATHSQQDFRVSYTSHPAFLPVQVHHPSHLCFQVPPSRWADLLPSNRISALHWAFHQPTSVRARHLSSAGSPLRLCTGQTPYVAPSAKFFVNDPPCDVYDRTHCQTPPRLAAVLHARRDLPAPIASNLDFW